jgi:RNA polymerase sigma-70 factor (ECF subfamily)
MHRLAESTPRKPVETAALRAAPVFDSPWASVVARIQAGDDSALSELYDTFSRGIRYYLCRHLGKQDLDDRLHDTFLIVVQAIRRGDLREPDRLMGFVRTVVRRQVASGIDQVVHNRREFADLEMGQYVPDARNNPEQRCIAGEKVSLMREVLRDISDRDREILTRFYLYEQTQEEICAQMNLTETQFRLLKSRAKARFGELGRRRLAPAPVRAYFVRKAAGAGD